jgi:integrase
MAQVHPLTIDRLTTAGLHSDAEVKGLYLQITKTGTKSWIFRFMRNRKVRSMGLGPYPVVKLAEARNKALAARKLLLDGKDPILVRNEDRTKLKIEQAKQVTFQEFALKFIEDRKSGWKNPRYAEQWKRSLERYVFPFFGETPISLVDVSAVMQVFDQKIGDQTFWHAHPKAGKDVRLRIEMILDAATVREFRSATVPNPARWKGHLKHVLSPRKKGDVKHFSSLHYDALPQFMTDLGKRKGSVARALEFTILSSARTNEVIHARWNEIDLEAKLWTIPKERMKGGREHRIPLSDAAMAVLKLMEPLRRSYDAFVFPGVKTPCEGLSDPALLKMCQRMNPDITVHGFRATFRTWVSEETTHQPEAAEASLAHKQDDLTEAYQRGALLEKRRRLMDDWGRFALYGPTPTLRLVS